MKGCYWTILTHLVRVGRKVSRNGNQSVLIWVLFLLVVSEFYQWWKQQEFGQNSSHRKGLNHARIELVSLTCLNRRVFSLVVVAIVTSYDLDSILKDHTSFLLIPSILLISLEHFKIIKLFVVIISIIF